MLSDLNDRIDSTFFDFVEIGLVFSVPEYKIEKNECIDCISSEMSKRKGTRGRSDENIKSWMKKRDETVCNMNMNMKKLILFKFLIIFILVGMCYFVFMGLGLDLNLFLLKLQSMLLGKYLNFLFSRLGWCGWALALLLTILRFDPETMMMDHSGASGSGSGQGRGFRWTDLFGSSSTGNSEPSINEPPGPEPVAPEVAQPDGGGPPIPEDPNLHNLIPIQARMEELRNRLETNSIGQNLSENQWKGIVAAQIVVEENVETALVEDGYPPDAILAKRHQIRGFMFYPSGTPLSEKTYCSYAKTVEDLGPRASVPYKRVMKALERYDIFLS